MNAVDLSSTAVQGLARLPLFADLSPRDLGELVAGSHVHSTLAGEILFEEGTPADGLYLVLSGALEVYRTVGAEEVRLEVLGPGTFLGEMALVEGSPRSASVRSVEESQLLLVTAEAFERLLGRSPAAALTVLRTMAGRLRSMEAVLVRSAALSTLGTLSAGLAHELNNPASALVRGVARLRSLLSELAPPSTAHPTELGEAPGPGPGAQAENSSDPAATLAAEDATMEWLAKRGIRERRGRIAALVQGGWTPGRMEELLESMAEEEFLGFLRREAARLQAARILEELESASGQVARVVATVRGQTPGSADELGAYDVVEGMESSLVLLRSRLAGRVDLIRRFPPGPVLIQAHGRELNQVWTNLVANALEAMEDEKGGRCLELEIAEEADRVQVRVADSGRGVPFGIADRIFDPFFTTRAREGGTGMGLHIARTVLRRHGGEVAVQSRPGRTTFTVLLPRGSEQEGKGTGRGS
jgi:signal transduction histidine kinase